MKLINYCFLILANLVITFVSLAGGDLDDDLYIEIEGEKYLIEYNKNLCIEKVKEFDVFFKQIPTSLLDIKEKGSDVDLLSKKLIYYGIFISHCASHQEVQVEDQSKHVDFMKLDYEISHISTFIEINVNDIDDYGMEYMLAVDGEYMNLYNQVLEKTNDILIRNVIDQK